MSSSTASSAEAVGRIAPDAPPAVRVEGVSVHYRVPRERVASIKDHLIRRFKGQVVFDDFMALQGVDLEVRKGETLGIVGANGAGKSTLLKLVAGVQRPTTGRVRVSGRVAPLLQLGAGFDTELTGRENVFLNGTLLGFRASDIARRLDRIVDFAGVRDFIDAPLRTYSTGMVARLGFAIATDVQPDVLIIDEILSVGDEEFQRRSAARIHELRTGGNAILLVSHSLEAIRTLCHRVAWLDRGRLRAVGPPDEIIQRYRRASGG
jgi:ABC-2 type transport system ATP-binding protein